MKVIKMNNFDKYFLVEECYFDVRVQDFAELIAKFSQIFITKGYVNVDWAQSMLTREKNYPTGLDMGAHCIAIPHTYSEFVQTSLIVPVVLQQKYPLSTWVVKKILLMLRWFSFY
ncbi:hypothetical protein SCLARK_001174 [Spiroplasma clarkii]|nr:hypothetical protein SCLARK_001174 [Spiroplasma clarkii]